MLINIGDEYVISTSMTEDGPICHITFPISKKDLQLLLLDDGSLDNIDFVVDKNWRGEQYDYLCSN